MTAPPGRRGFSMVETLVVLAIVGLLASVVYPVFVGARQRARMSVSIEHLKQIHVGFRLYTEDWDRRPDRLDKLFDDYVGDAEILASPADTFLERGGWLRVHTLECINPAEPPWRTPVSYGYFGLMAHQDRNWRAAQRLGGNAGYVVDVLFGVRNGAGPTRLAGRTVRLCMDGHVVVLNVDLPYGETNYWKLCTDQQEPPE